MNDTSSDSTKNWRIKVSNVALNTKNPIRGIVDNLKVPNIPGKALIPLSLGTHCYTSCIIANTYGAHCIFLWPQGFNSMFLCKQVILPSLGISTLLNCLFVLSRII